MVLVLALAVYVAGWVALLVGIEPVPTWFYVVAWYPTLVVADDLAFRLGGRPRLLRRPATLLSLLGWSVPIWLLFEAANFRLANWYYVLLPRAPAERWAGIVLSYATVVPAVLVSARLLEAARVGRRWRTRPLPLRPGGRVVSFLLGLVLLALGLGWPRTFFPFLWGALWLLTDPLVHARRPEWSLLADLERGDWSRIGRLLLGGLAIGILWEFYNHWARGQWIYTVPGFERWKLFEMPPLGFLGFPFLALEVWAIYHALCVMGFARPTDGHPLKRAPRHPALRVLSAAGAVVFSILVLLGMERWTISSVVPRLDDLPTIDAADAQALARAGIPSPFALATQVPESVATRTGRSADEARRWINAARLATLRGLGAIHAERLRRLDIGSVCELARREPADLWLWLLDVPADPAASTPAPRPTPAEVRVWVRAARRECRDGPTG